MSARIYPVPIKGPSGITNWGQWPEDVEPIIWRWNKGKGLTFSWPRHRVFKCTDCAEFCHQLNAAVLHGDLLCDDCLIERARVSLRNDVSPEPGPTSTPLPKDVGEG